MFFFIILWAILFGVACHNIAKSKGLDPAGYTLAGAILGIFGLILVLCVPAAQKDA